MTAARIVFLSANNNALDDARLLRQVDAAGQFGHQAIAIGTKSWGEDEEHTVPGGRVIVKRLSARFGGRGVTARLAALGRALAPYGLKASPGEARALAAFLARDAAQGGGSPAARLARRTHSLAIRALVKARQTARRRGGADRAGPAYGQAERRERDRARALAFYRRCPAAARWRIVTPEHIDEELAIGPLLDRLAPDIIHVHDVYLMGVAAAAQARARAQGRRVQLVYDAREFVRGLAVTPPRRVAAQANLEREFIGRFERVITVSESLADLLVAEHRLTRRPDLILNAPVVSPRRPGTPDIREAAGVPAEAPLMIYGGGVNPARGVQTAIAALADLPAAHLAVVIRHTRWMPHELLELARGRGVADRLHLVPFVDHDQVAAYFESADLGLSPLLHTINHDVALTNKFCEYLQAGLPIVTSDTPEQARLVTELDLGAVHRAGDAADLARAAAETFDRLAELKARIAGDSELRHRFSWAAQVPVLERVYREVTAR
ncbi:MAG: glycosyltransferase family 4 protein [Bifidobacteriaceae bacterium]|nr:glycosyltransferase family 4 protein [Bifidobacteriaceae bacterium]